MTGGWGELLQVCCMASVQSVRHGCQSAEDDYAELRVRDAEHGDDDDVRAARGTDADYYDMDFDTFDWHSWVKLFWNATHPTGRLAPDDALDGKSGDQSADLPPAWTGTARWPSGSTED